MKLEYSTQHDEFIKATFSIEEFIETNNIFAIRGKKPFLFHCVRELRQKTLEWCQITIRNKINFRIKPFLSLRTFSLNNEAKNRRQAFFQIIIGCHISNNFFYLKIVQS